MITDSQSNKLFLADCLPSKHPMFFEHFKSLLTKNQISIELLQNTKDIWAVDYMPIQVTNEKFVQFVYNPDYLQSKNARKTISDVDAICDNINLIRQKSKIVLDGGNVVKSANKVIMCDKVFDENPNYKRKELINELVNLFEIDRLLLVPTQPKDYFGHADAMIRFIDDHTVIVNDYSNEKKPFQRAFKIAIENAGLNYIEIPYNLEYNKKDDGSIGCYMNYLQMSNLIVVPTFGIPEDEIAVRMFEDIFRGSAIETIDSREIAEKGGVLNCITWNIKIN